MVSRLLPAPPPMDAADAALVALYAEWRDAVDALARADAEVDRAETSAQQRGVRLSSCPAVAAASRAQREGYAALHALAQRAALMQARGLNGLALKMVMWRWESALGLEGVLETTADLHAFSVYRDLLRLAGLKALAHADDGDTLADLRAAER